MNDIDNNQSFKMANYYTFTPSFHQRYIALRFVPTLEKPLRKTLPNPASGQFDQIRNVQCLKSNSLSTDQPSVYRTTEHIQNSSALADLFTVYRVVRCLQNSYMLTITEQINIYRSAQYAYLEISSEFTQQLNMFQSISILLKCKAEHPCMRMRMRNRCGMRMCSFKLVRIRSVP